MRSDRSISFKSCSKIGISARLPSLLRRPHSLGGSDDYNDLQNTGYASCPYSQPIDFDGGEEVKNRAHGNLRFLARFCCKTAERTQTSSLFINILVSPAAHF